MPKAVQNEEELHKDDVTIQYLRAYNSHVWKNMVPFFDRRRRRMKIEGVEDSDRQHDHGLHIRSS